MSNRAKLTIGLALLTGLPVLAVSTPTENVTATPTACTMFQHVNLLMADLGHRFMLSSTGVV